MYAIKKLRLNRFKKVDIPSPRALFEKCGFKQPQQFNGIDPDMSADELTQAVPQNLRASKLNALHLGEMTAKKASEFKDHASETQSLNVRDVQKL